MPPLIFEAAFHLEFAELRRNLRPILLLAVAGVLITTALVGAIVAFGTGMTLASGLVFGALIAATDPVAVVALFRALGAPKSLTLAERLHLSGVLAVVAAGIVCGNLGLKGMSPTTRIVLFNFWEYLAFIANSLVFLLIGLDINLPDLLAQLGPIAVGVVAVLLSRLLVIYGLTWLSNRGRGRIPLSYQHVQFWGGLRGAISLALALSLPASFADRELVLVMTFGVVLFTLLVQGTTMNALLLRLGLVQREEAQLEYERRHARRHPPRGAAG